jgi:isopenicillin N synthase-like dioxygenase
MSHLHQVPTLDLRRFHSADRNAFVKEMGDAYRQFGFCCFSHHGIPEERIQQGFEAFRAFFALPREEKRRYITQNLPGTRGFTDFKVETAKTSKVADLKEFWHVGREVTGPNPYPDILLDNVWPDGVPEFKEHALALYRAMERAGNTVASALALNIGLPEDYFTKVSAFGNSILRALHYPPVRPEDLPAVRAEAHEDISLITLLVGATDSGLQLLTRENTWLPIEAAPNTLVVNVGDMLQRLTNHVYPSTTHRVVNPEGPAAARPRYSMPFFMDPNPDFLIETLPSCITPDNPNRYDTPITANDYLMERLHEIKMTPKTQAV